MAPRTRSQKQSAGSPLKEPLESEPRRTRTRTPRGRSASTSAAVPAKNTEATTSKKSSKKSKTLRKFLALLDGTPEEEDAMDEDPQQEASTQIPSVPKPYTEDAMDEDPQEESSTQIPPLPQAHGSTHVPSIPQEEASAQEHSAQPYRKKFFTDGPSSSPLSSPNPIVVAKARRVVRPKTAALHRKKARRPLAGASPMPNSDGDHYTSEEFTLADALIRDYQDRVPAVPSCGDCKGTLVKVFFCTACNKVAEDPASHSSCSSHSQDTKLTKNKAPASRKRSIEEPEQDSVPAAKRQNLGVNHTGSSTTPSRSLIRPFNTERPARRNWFPPKSSEVAIEWQKATVNGADLFESIARGGAPIPLPPRNKEKEVEAANIRAARVVSQPEVEPTTATSTSAVQGVRKLFTSSPVSPSSTITEASPQPTSFLQRVLPRFFSPAKPERPIAQPRKPSALSQSLGTGNPFALAGTGSMESTSAVDHENVDPVGGPVVKRAGRHASHSTPRMPKRFEHKPPVPPAADSTSGVTTLYKTFGSEEEFIAAAEKALEERQNSRQTDGWLRERRIQQRAEHAEKEAQTGEKRKRQPHNTRVPYNGYQAGRTPDGRGFSAEVTHLSTDESDDNRDMITPPNQNDSSPGSDVSPAKPQDTASSGESPAKRLKFIISDNPEETIRERAIGGVKTMPDGTRHFPDGSIAHPDGRFEGGIARGRWDPEQERWVNGRPDSSVPRTMTPRMRLCRNSVVAQQKANDDAAKLRKEIEEEEALSNKRNPQAITFGISDDFFDLSDSDEELEADVDRTTPSDTASGSLSTPDLSSTSAASGSLSTPDLSISSATSGSLSTPDLSGSSTSAETQWTQPPPSRPTPAHASLPGQETDTPAKSPTEQEIEIEMALAISKQIAAAQKYKPANPSHLRQERTVDSPLVVSNLEDHKWKRGVRHAIMSIDEDQFEEVEFPQTESYVEAGVVDSEVQAQLDHDIQSDPYAKDQLDKEFDHYMASAELMY